ncbi:MAG: sirohydrochlorin cobaltochelatase [Mogibacterium sp.]|nr:sirohydrochlorin cobaltochelatase [Mogibacterium sp.]
MVNCREREVVSADEILVVSFGTVSPESRRLNIDAVEQAIRDSAGDMFQVCRCFTSQTVINIINKKQGIRIDNINEALDKAVRSGVRNLAVQPTHLMKGQEYEKLKSVLAGYTDSFRHIALGDPLLSSEEDFRLLADALIEVSCQYDDGKTAVVFMGHGTGAASNDVYLKMQNTLLCSGKNNYYIGTVEAEPSVEDVLNAVRKGNYSRAVLRPLMLVAGNHAVNDMASADDPDSWYSRFTAAGYETVCVIEGLGQIPAVRDIYVCHAKRAVSSLDQ